MAEPLEQEIAAYERERSRLEQEHAGKFVAIHGDEIIGSYDTFDTAAEEAVRRFNQGPYLIREVGQDEISLPLILQYGLN